MGALAPHQQRAVQAGREALAVALEAAFPRFHWKMPLVSHPERSGAGPDEPADRLQQGAQERDARAWDFALVVTPQDLHSYYKSYALAVPSRALAVAVLSLARLESSGEGDEDALARRVQALALHLFGDLNGLWHSEDPRSAMRPPDAAGDLDRELRLDANERQALAEALEQVADLRLEETSTPTAAWLFYLRGARERAGEIASAVLQARPWEFPLRLSRLTAAALSALFLLLMTAEVWDLGTTQRPETLVGLSVLVVAGATAFILARQRLLLRRSGQRISEQTVVSNVSATLIVLLGMLTSWTMLFALTALLAWTLFGPELIARWAPTVAPDATAPASLTLAGLVASLGLLIGSLGASFEGQHYFRHVIYADEET